MLFVLAAALLTPAASGAQEIWAHPQRLGSLHAAVAVAALHGHATIHLAAGRHVLAAPLVLDARHSGTRFVGHGGASVAGSVNVSGWSIAGSARCAGCSVIWKTAVPKGADSRQFYVDGVRANRTWRAFPAGGSNDVVKSVYTVPGVALLGWKHNVSAIELVYRGACCGNAANSSSAGSPWQESRCPVAQIAAQGAAAANVTVVQPCGWNSNHVIGGKQARRLPAYVENVFELLGDAVHGHAGEYFLDSAAGLIYYVPQAGQDAKTTVGQLPLLEELVVATGVRDVSHEGITFELATWNGPSHGGTGFVDIQGGFCMVCAVGDPACTVPKCPAGPHGIRETPAALRFLAATNVSFDNCKFLRIGSNALSFTHGSKANEVRRCRFDDISASAVQIGLRAGDPTNRTVAQQEIGNAVTDCTITRTAREYRGAPSVSVGWSRGTRIQHNEISQTPYTAISLGWGWNSYPYSFDGDNHIDYNHIHHHMQLLDDGGAIYTLGEQGNMPFEWPAKFKNRSAILPPSTQIGNWIHDGGNKESAARDHDGVGVGLGLGQPGGLYSDEGTTNFNISGNVVQHVANWLQGCRPGCPWIGPNWQNKNFYDNASKVSINMQARCPLVGDVMLKSARHEHWPAEARAIVAAAGPRAAVEPAAAPPQSAWKKFDGENNVYGAEHNGTSTGTIKFLGSFDSAALCAAAVKIAKVGTYHSWTWHQDVASNQAYRKQCFGRTDRTWAPHAEPAIDSGRFGSDGFSLSLFTDPMAVCLDGTRAGFYTRPGTNESWVIELEGGGWCFDEADCLARAKTDIGSSKRWPQTGCPVMDGGSKGMLSSDCAVSSLCNWTAVHLNYCDGASFAGFKREPVAVNGTALYFRGRTNLDASIDALLADGMSEAKEIVFKGCSAGGLATILHVDYFAARVHAVNPRARVTAMPDAGFFLDHNSVDHQATWTPRYQHIAKMQNTTAAGSVNDACLAHYAPKGEAWKCFMAQYTLPFLQTPYFMTQDTVDSWQMLEIFNLKCFPASCNATELAQGNEYRKDMLVALAPLITPAAGKKNKNGGFITACYQHCHQNHARPWVNASMKNQTLAATWDAWYHSKAGAPTLLVADHDFNPNEPNSECPGW